MRDSELPEFRQLWSEPFEIKQKALGTPFALTQR
jgi:hypothetical protein